MPGQTRATSLRALRRLWGQWTAIVELYARQRPRRGRVSFQGYRLLHGELLATCRALAKQSGNAHADFYEDLRFLAQPWLTLWVLQQTDKEILLNLLGQCENAYCKLGGSKWTRWQRPLIVSALVVVCAVGAGLVVWQVQPQWLLVADWLDDQRRWLLLSAKRVASWEWLLLFGALGIIVAMFAVSRAGWRR
jgi:hypothetical protein